MPETVVDSIWMRCFFEIYDKVKARGEPVIEFSDVDNLVVEYSKMPIKEFLKKFKD